MAEYKKLKNRTAMSVTLENEIYGRLKKYSEITSVPITRILDKAVVMYLDSVKGKD